MSGTYRAYDPRTGQECGPEFTDATMPEVEDATAQAAGAAASMRAASDATIARLLHAAAEHLEAAGDQLIEAADRETALGVPRLTGELARTCAQLRAFSAAVGSGWAVEAVLDSPRPEAVPPCPDLRRMLVPIGPVAVFGASNFPLAFSVPGGDTAAALAARCPVVAKAHPAHPATSELAAGAISRAVAEVGLPAACFSLLHGASAEVGRALVNSMHIKAVGFTGSGQVGRSLMDLAAARPTPIPVYAEMGSLNPIVLSPGALAARGEQLAEGLAQSFTLGGGQFCTKPGLALVIDDAAGRRWLRELTAIVDKAPPVHLLGPGLHAALVRQVADSSSEHGATVLARGGPPGEGLSQEVVLLSAPSTALRAGSPLLEEHFGPVLVVVLCDDEVDLLDTIEQLGGNLTATLHTEPDEGPFTERLIDALSLRAGRLVFGGYPTGVAVTEAMTHGGPYPAASNPFFTSVGLSAIRRFQRPVTWQGASQDQLPAALRDANPLGILRRVDGIWSSAPR